MRIFHAPEHREHAPPTEIQLGREVAAVEVPARAEEILAALMNAGHTPERASDPGIAPLRAVHDMAYLGHLATAWDGWVAEGGDGPLAADTFRLASMGASGPPAGTEARAGWYAFDASTPILEGTARAARAAAGCALAAARAVAGGERAAYALCRPPGHHAGPAFSGGYCYLNNAAIAAAALAADGARVAILDLDFHHGNGTQRIFWDDPRVVYASLHADPDTHYPYYSGRADERGADGRTTINLPLPAGTGDDAYAAALEDALARIAETGCDLLVVSLGLDGFADDPICTFALSADAYGASGERVASLELPAVVVQEGGYALGSLGDLATRFLAPLDQVSSA